MRVVKEPPSIYRRLTILNLGAFFSQGGNEIEAFALPLPASAFVYDVLPGSHRLKHVRLRVFK